MIRPTLLIAALLAAPAVASAQLCIGAPSLAVSRLNVTMGGEFTDGAKGFGGGLTVGGSSGFVNAGVSRLSFDELDAGATVIAGSAGLSFTATPQSSVQFCPVASAAFGLGPDVTLFDGFEFFDIKTRTLGVSGGVAIGGAVEVSPGLSVVPNILLAVLHQRIELSDDFDSISDNETGGLIAGGISLLLGEVFAIRPAVSIPLGFEGSDPVFSIGFTVGFRR